MKKKLLNIPNKEIKNPIFIREIDNHLKIYVIDEFECSKFKTYQDDRQIVSINCQILEYIEEEDELVYNLKKPTSLFPISSDKIELMMVKLE